MTISWYASGQYSAVGVRKIPTISVSGSSVTRTTIGIAIDAVGRRQKL